MHLLEVSNISKTYGDTEVLKNISLSIEDGEFVTIMGSSGSGKSTLLYIMGGMEIPASGCVLLSGRDVNRLSDKHKSRIRQSELGFVFQFYNLVHNLTVEENILLPVLLSGKKKRETESRLAELLQMVGLMDHRRKNPSQLSGGQQQRVAIARAVINNPRLLLADEPTGNLDSASALQVMDMLRELNREFKTTIVHVTHNAEWVDYGNRLLTIKDGRLLSDEKPACEVRRLRHGG